jgi:hypothetical protein
VAEAEREPGRFRQWVDDNLVQLILFGIAFGGSFTHWIHLASRNGQPGLLSYIAAICVDLGVYRVAKERQRDARIGRQRRGPVSMPTAMLFGLIALTLAGNLASAKHTAWGIVTALIPGVMLLMSIALMERRATEDQRRAVAERERQEAEQAEADRQAERQSGREERQRRLAERHAAIVTPAGEGHAAIVNPASANVTHLPSAGQAGGSMVLPAGALEAAPANATGVMRAFWDREVSAGRIPSGADLLRAAGLSAASSLGRQNAAKWRQELDQARGSDDARGEVSA